MKVICQRCKYEVEYDTTPPEVCPRCGDNRLIAEKTEEEKSRDAERLRLPESMKNIPPSSRKRRFLLVFLALFDFGIPFIGWLLTKQFTFLTYKPEKYLFWLGVVTIFVGVYRIIYHVVMSHHARRAILKENYTSVLSLIPYLRLKTRSDVLRLLKRYIKYGIITGVEIRNGEDIIKK